jgi:CDP-paratose 2-epimerase
MGAGGTSHPSLHVRIVVTGGAGFVGATLSLRLKERHADWEIIAFDNLKRRGSELNLARLRSASVAFRHGDVRAPSDLDTLGDFDALVECSAEPSAQAGLRDSPQYVVETNLVGAHHCLEAARRCGAFVVFLSTSRVYPVAALRGLALREDETRFELEESQPVDGVSLAGVSERFPLGGARTLYGATKLAAELLIAEYGDAYGLRTVVDRCGVIAGPWQMGKVDQGVFTYWVAGHRFGRELRYFGYGGSGKQVRDVLHVDDLAELVEDQLVRPGHWSGLTVNVGGGRPFSLSLREATELCREITGNEVPVGGRGEESPSDVPLYVSDCAWLFAHTNWRPRREPRAVLEDIDRWIREHEPPVRQALGW